MNYLKTAASVCASILLLFPPLPVYAVEVVEQGSAVTPTEADKTGYASDGTPTNGGSGGILSGLKDTFGLGDSSSSKAAVEKTTEGTGEMGAYGCPKNYESVTAVKPQAEKTAGGLDCARAAIGQFSDAVVGGSARINGATEIMALHKEYQSNWTKCQNYQSAAAAVCIADNSLALADGITLINGLLSAGGAASIYDKCTTFGKAMDIGQKALAAYTAACTMARQPCVMFCGNVKEALTKFQAALGKVPPTGVCETGGSYPAKTPADAACALAHQNFTKHLPNAQNAIKSELDEGNIKASGGKFSRCDRKYWQNVASAGVGILQLANSLKQGKECQEESSAVADATPTCDIPANANLPECLCLANPRMAGCSSGLSQVGELSAGSGQAITGGGLVSEATVGSLGKDSTSIAQGERNSASGSGSGVGAPTGGGPSLGSIGGGSGGGVGEKGAGGGSGLNTDILSGAGGGGGGGGFAGYRGGSGDSKGLRSYLPGGAKDPKRGLAGQGVGSKEVTGQAGKSNWEKVRDRYIDNKNSLLGN